jgi:hypothetical protein
MLSCKKENINQSILGHWEWQETNYHSRGIHPYTLTPSTTDTSMVIHVNPTTIEIFKNGSYFGEFTYSTNTVVGERNVISVDYNNASIGLGVEEGPFSIENGKLSIAGGYNNAGGTQIFKRLKL